ATIGGQSAVWRRQAPPRSIGGRPPPSCPVNAHLRPLTLRRSLKQKAMGRLKQLEIIVRRLLTLMALALTLPAVRPRTRLTCATHTPLPEGTEIVTFPAPRRFAL
ncbi:MAG: hypothetical protein ABIH17_09760, partial [Pseudomonadota bacterium]